MENLIRSSLDSIFVLTQPKNEFVTTEFLSLVIAFFAVVFSPLIQIMISKRQLKLQAESLDKQLKTQEDSLEKQLEHQLISIDKQIRSTVLSKNRQDWINNLRDNVSSFISVVFALVLMNKSTYNEIRGKLEELTQRSSKIKLLINPIEDDHKILVKNIELITNHIIDAFTDKDIDAKLKNINFAKQFINELIIISQKIFKREWERVKTLE